MHIFLKMMVWTNLLLICDPILSLASEEMMLWAYQAYPVTTWDSSSAKILRMDEINWCLQPQGVNKQEPTVDGKIATLTHAHKYHFLQAHNTTETLLCAEIFTPKQVVQFNALIDEQYWYQYLIEGHPVSSLFGARWDPTEDRKEDFMQWFTDHGGKPLDIEPSKITQAEEPTRFLYTHQEFVFHTKATTNEISFVELVKRRPRPILIGEKIKFTYSTLWKNDGFRKEDYIIKQVSSILDRPPLLYSVFGPFCILLAAGIFLLVVLATALDTNRRDIFVWSEVLQNSFERPYSFPSIYALFVSVGLACGASAVTYPIIGYNSIFFGTLTIGLGLRYFQIMWEFRLNPFLLCATFIIFPSPIFTMDTLIFLLTISGPSFLPMSPLEHPRSKELYQSTRPSDFSLVAIAILPTVLCWFGIQIFHEELTNPMTSQVEWGIASGMFCIIITLTGVTCHFAAEFLLRRKASIWYMFFAQASTGLYVWSIVMYNYHHMFQHLSSSMAITYRGTFGILCLGLGLYLAASNYIIMELCRTVLRKKYPLVKLRFWD